jgi:hypothetical protein
MKQPSNPFPKEQVKQDKEIYLNVGRKEIDHINKDADIDREMQRHGDRVTVVYDSDP